MVTNDGLKRLFREVDALADDGGRISVSVHDVPDSLIRDWSIASRLKVCGYGFPADLRGEVFLVGNRSRSTESGGHAVVTLFGVHREPTAAEVGECADRWGVEVKFAEERLRGGAA